MVDLDAFRCGCKTSPSPWEPVDAPEKKENIVEKAIAYLAFAVFLLPGLWLSIPLQKLGVLKPSTGEKRSLAEMLNFFLFTLIGTVITYIALAVAMGIYLAYRNG